MKQLINPGYFFRVAACLLLFFITVLFIFNITMVWNAIEYVQDILTSPSHKADKFLFLLSK